MRTCFIMFHGLPSMCQTSPHITDTSWTLHPLFSVTIVAAFVYASHVHTIVLVVYKRTGSNALENQNTFALLIPPKSHKSAGLTAAVIVQECLKPCLHHLAHHLAFTYLWVVTCCLHQQKPTSCCSTVLRQDYMLL